MSNNKKIQLTNKEKLFYKIRTGKELTENDINSLTYLLAKNKIDYKHIFNLPQTIAKKIILKSRNADTMFVYSVYMIKQRWPEAEEYIKKDNYLWQNYLSHFGFDKVDEDVTDLSPIPQKDWERINKETNPLYDPDKEKKRNIKKPGTFQRFDMGQRINKIVKEELNRLLESKNFRLKLAKKLKRNKICPECHMPENACKHTEYSGPQGAKTLLDREMIKDFRMSEVAVIRDKKRNKFTIMKDSLGGISCDCNHYLREGKMIKPCIHIQKYLSK